MKKLQKIGLVMAVGAAFWAVSAFAGPMKGRQDSGSWPRPVPRPEPWPEPRPEPGQHDSGQDSDQRGQSYGHERSVWFNVVCRYEKGPQHCQAAARFEKRVERDGGEFLDDSLPLAGPEFVVECDEGEIYGATSRRFTDRDGTRIQALSGPYPAISLPREALSDGHRRVDSVLELRNGFLSGTCYLYTGSPNP